MASRMATCPECGMQFSYEVGRGNDRKYCGPACASKRRLRRFKARMAKAAECEVDGCFCRIRSPGSTLCEKHYMRNRRRGTVRKAREVSPPKPELPHSGGYVLEYMPEHILWGETKGRLYQHRRVFFDRYGKGPFDCHWCGQQVSWNTMHVDHVNAIRDDNRIENLVPSCPLCNQKRGHEKMKATRRKRSATRIEWNGESLCVSEWAERLNISATSVKWRMSKGWPIERIVTEPRGRFGPRSDRRAG